jgi:hypothetical protein
MVDAKQHEIILKVELDDLLSDEYGISQWYSGVNALFK